MPDSRRVEQRRNEQGQFTGDFFFAPPDLPEAAEPPPLPSAQDQRDDAFMARNSVDPQISEQAPIEEEGPSIAESVGAAQTGAKAGGILGGPVGAVVGGAAGFLAAQIKSKPSPIGSLEGGAVQGEDSASRGIQELIAIQKGIARVGSPIKDAITTQAAGSRM